jgi:hypothetical protein
VSFRGSSGVRASSGGCLKWRVSDEDASSAGSQAEGAVVLFLRPKMVRVRLLSRDLFSELSFLADRPERTERASAAWSSLYLSL